MTPEEIAQKYLTPRYLELDKYEAVVEGRQYAGRAPFLSTSEEAPPLLERAPCIVDPIVEKARNAHCDFVLGEGRWPSITSFTSEDDRKRDPDYGLSEDDSDDLDWCVSKVVEQTRLRAMARNALENALDCGSAASVVGVRDGALFVENVRAATCTPTFDPKRPCEVLSLEIRYPYIEQYWDDADRKYKPRCMIYRRVIDATRDVEFQPARAREDGLEPTWTEKPSAPHELGFCPVRWYACLSACRMVTQIDGKPLHKGLLDEIEAYHFSDSQRHRASFYGGDPEKIEIAGDKYDGIVTSGGRTAALELAKDGVSPMPGGTYGRAQLSGGGGVVRRKGVHIVARYEHPDTKVSLLTLPDGALAEITKNADSLAAKIRAGLRHVDLDTESLKSTTVSSAKELETRFQAQINFDNTLREDFGNGWLLPVVDMLLRVALVVGRKGDGLYLPGLKKLVALLGKFEKQMTNGATRWFSPHLDLVWGPYFAKGAADQKIVAETVALAREKRLVPLSVCLDKLKQEGIFPIGSVEDLAGEMEPTDSPAVDPETGEPVDPNAATDTAAPTDGGTITLAPTDQAAIVRVDEARDAYGLQSIGADGKLTIAEFKSKHSEVVASSAAADAGKTEAVDPAKEAKAKADALAKQPKPPGFGGAPPGAPPFGKPPTDKESK